MSVGAGFFDLAIIATFMGLAGLILFNFFEKSLSKDNYRILQITSDINYDINPLIEIVNARNLKIMHQDREMDYDSKRKIIKFNIRISQKGYSDNIAEDIIPAIEKADLPLYSVKWYHV